MCSGQKKQGAPVMDAVLSGVLTEFRIKRCIHHRQKTDCPR